MLSRLLLVSLVVLLPLSLFGCQKADHFHHLTYQEYPLDARGILTYDDQSYEVLLTVAKAGDLKLQILTPERVAGMILELSDGKAFLRFDQITAELGPEAYAAKEGILLAAQMFSLSSKSYNGAGVITQNNLRYSYAKYEVKDGSVTVFIPDGSSMPDHMTAELNGHTFVFQFVNES